jgi:hypothetical protein
VTTINEDGGPVLIEALYARHFCLYVEECDSLEEAIQYLESGADYGECAPVGVLVEGEPRVYGSFDPKPPNEEQALEMRRLYGLVKAHAGKGAPAVPWECSRERRGR